MKGDVGWGNSRRTWSGGVVGEYDQDTLYILTIFSKTK